MLRFQDVHVERCNSRSTTDRTDEMEHFEDFCRIPSLHGENGMFCKSGKRSFSDLKISMLNDVIPGVLRIERMKWSISRISVAFLVCMVKTVCFARVGKGVFQISRCPWLNDVIPGVLRIDRMKWSISSFSVAFLVCMVKMVCFARVGKDVFEISRCPC